MGSNGVAEVAAFERQVTLATLAALSAGQGDWAGAAAKLREAALVGGIGEERQRAWQALASDAAGGHRLPDGSMTAR